MPCYVWLAAFIWWFYPKGFTICFFFTHLLTEVHVLYILIYLQRWGRSGECWKGAAGSESGPVRWRLHSHSEGVSDSIYTGCTLVCRHSGGSAAADSWQQSGWEAAHHYWSGRNCLQESCRVSVLEHYLIYLVLYFTNAHIHLWCKE